MPVPSSSAEYGTDVETDYSLDNPAMFFPKVREHKGRIYTRNLHRFYICKNLVAATTTVGTYLLGIVPIDGYVVSIKHVARTITSAATLEVKTTAAGVGGAKDDIMTAQTIADAIATATLGTTAQCTLVQGDVLAAIIATTSGAVVDLCILITIQPKY